MLTVYVSYRSFFQDDWLWMQYRGVTFHFCHPYLNATEKEAKEVQKQKMISQEKSMIDIQYIDTFLSLGKISYIEI